MQKIYINFKNLQIDYISPTFKDILSIFNGRKEKNRGKKSEINQNDHQKEKRKRKKS